MHHPIVFEPAQMGDNEVEVRILPGQHFYCCQASYYIDHKGELIAPGHFAHLAPWKCIEAMNLQSAKTVVFDRSTDHELDSPGITSRVDRCETDQLVGILTHNVCQADVRGGIVAIKDGKDDRFIDTGGTRPFEVGLDTRFSVPGAMKAIALPGMA